MKTAGEKVGEWESGMGAAYAAALRAGGHTLQWGERSESGGMCVTLECSCGAIFSREMMGQKTRERTGANQAEAWRLAKLHLRAAAADNGQRITNPS